MMAPSSPKPLHLDDIDEGQTQSSFPSVLRRIKRERSGSNAKLASLGSNIKVTTKSLERILLYLVN